MPFQNLKLSGSAFFQVQQIIKIMPLTSFGFNLGKKAAPFPERLAFPTFGS
jgi:hypothetical protein